MKSPHKQLKQVEEMAVFKLCFFYTVLLASLFQLSYDCNDTNRTDSRARTTDGPDGTPLPHNDKTRLRRWRLLNKPNRLFQHDLIAMWCCSIDTSSQQTRHPLLLLQMNHPSTKPLCNSSRSMQQITSLSSKSIKRNCVESWVT